MPVKFVEIVQNDLNIKDSVFAKMLGISLQAIRKMLGKTATKRPQTGMDLRTLSRMRKLSGRTWNQFGKLIDDEFGE